MLTMLSENNMNKIFWLLKNVRKISMGQWEWYLNILFGKRNVSCMIFLIGKEFWKFKIEFGVFFDLEESWNVCEKRVWNNHEVIVMYWLEECVVWAVGEHKNYAINLYYLRGEIKNRIFCIYEVRQFSIEASMNWLIFVNFCPQKELRKCLEARFRHHAFG